MIICGGIVYYFKRMSSNPKLDENIMLPKPTTVETKLTMSGWIKISYTVLSSHDAVEKRQKEKQHISNPSFIPQLTMLYHSTSSFSSYIISRFLGKEQKLQYPIEVEPPKPYEEFYGVLVHKSLFLYKDQTRQECVLVILIPQYSVQLIPHSLTEHELFMPHNPIALHLLEDTFNAPEKVYIYPETSSEKENWFIMLRRSCTLPPFADDEALTSFYHDSTSMKQFKDAMKKLEALTKGDNEAQDLSATAWLNALFGRMFVAIHANPNVKAWVIQRLSRHTLETEDEDSFLGDIVIQDMDVGNSLPIISNPKLVSISDNGDMSIEMDIEYTGGIRIEACTCATLSVPAWVIKY
jgi:hypothetical protein